MSIRAIFLTTAIFIGIITLSFGQTSQQNQRAHNTIFSTDWYSLTKDYMTWYNYTYYNIHLSQNFIGLDLDSTKIEKSVFLDKLTSGDLIAFNTSIVNRQPVYKLFKLNSDDESIKATIKQMADTEIRNSKMEGTRFPEFGFTDLTGQSYNNISSIGKLTVLKCWFIHCAACVKEFPELNALVNQYQSDSGVQFISLALDKKSDLIKFLKKEKFKYAVIPEMEFFMKDQLKITAYPTHMLIDKNGIIIKVVHTIEELIPFLEKEKSERLP